MKKILSIFSINLIIFLFFISYIILTEKFKFSSKYLFIIFLFLFLIICCISIFFKKPRLVLIGIIILIFLLIFSLRTIIIENDYNNIIKNFKNYKEIIGYIDF